jgi:hypothetical protein
LVATLAGAMLHETIRNTVAKSLGYHHNPNHTIGELFFISDTMQAAFKPIAWANREAIYHTHKNFKDKPKWDALVYQDMKDHAMIELSGWLYTLTISFTGIIILLARRKKRKADFELMDWVAIVMALTILKQVFFSFLFLTLGSMPCDIAKMARFFSLPVFTTEKVQLVIGICFSYSIVAFTIPKVKIFPFLIGGLIGGVAGFLLYFFFISRILFGAW